MQRKWTCVLAGFAALTLVASSAQASDQEVQDQLEEMRDMVLQLQDQMQAQQQTIESQQEVIQEAGLDEEGSQSALSSFLESTEFSGWITASYTVNTNFDGRGGQIGQNVGADGLRMPFKPDSNTFAVDQLWFSMDKDVSEESRGGFHADILFGKDATLLGENAGAFAFGDNSGVSLFTAYVSYLAPVGNGLRFDMGELPTLIGAEAVQSTANFNITRGIVWSLQPVTNTGILFSTDAGPLSLALGAVNDFTSATSTDADNNKALTASVGMGGDMFSGSVNLNWGSVGNPVNSDLRGGILDFVFTADPTDTLSMWANVDYIFTHDDLIRTDSVATALAARLAVTDDFGVAVRGEYVALDPGFAVNPGDGDRLGIYSVTGTLDYMLAQGLMTRVEVRWDGSEADDWFFNQGGNLREDNQVTLMLDLTYQF